MKNSTLICVSLFLLTISINAQDITNKLGGTSDAETYDVTDSADKVLLRVQADGKVGIGDDTPTEVLEVNGNIAVSGTVDGVDIASDVTANNAKVSNATHTGDVTGITGLTIGDDKVLEQHLKAIDTPNDEEYLTYETTTGDFEWQTIPASHDAVTIGTANGLSLSTQQLSLSTATTSAAGAMSSADKTKLDGLSGSGDSDWTISGNDMYSTVSGNVGIGTTTPDANLDVHGTVKVFGAMETRAPGFANVTQATTDGFVICYVTGAPAGIQVYSDSNPSPSTTVQMATSNNGGGTINVMVPIRKGNFWWVNVVGGTPTVYWIPLGQ